MFDESTQEAIAKAARTQQIVIGAMCMGIVIFWAITLVVSTQSQQKAAPLFPFSLTLIAAALVAGSLVVRGVIVWVIAKRARTQIAADKTEAAGFCERSLLNVYQVRTLIGGAMLEGMAFFALIAFMIERSPLALGLGVFMLLGIAMHFPTPSRIGSWIKSQAEMIETERRDSAEYSPHHR